MISRLGLSSSGSSNNNNNNNNEKSSSTNLMPSIGIISKNTLEGAMGNILQFLIFNNNNSNNNNKLFI